MIKQTAVKPLERQAKIMEGLKMNNDKYRKDPYANEFGISVSGEVGGEGGDQYIPKLTKENREGHRPRPNH